jgi:hypothetical protein
MAGFAVGLSPVLLLVTSFSFAQNDPAAGIQLFLYALTNCWSLLLLRAIWPTRSTAKQLKPIFHVGV